MSQYTVNLHLMPEMPDVCLSFVLLFTIIIVVTQKPVLQQSKNVTDKCTETLSPPPLLLILYITTQFSAKLLLFIILGLGQDDFWAEHCGQDRLGGQARTDQVLHMRSMYKIDREGGGKTRSLTNYQCSASLNRIQFKTNVICLYVSNI